MLTERISDINRLAKGHNHNDLLRAWTLLFAGVAAIKNPETVAQNFIQKCNDRQIRATWASFALMAKEAQNDEKNQQTS